MDEWLLESLAERILFALDEFSLAHDCSSFSWVSDLKKKKIHAVQNYDRICHLACKMTKRCTLNLSQGN